MAGIRLTWEQMIDQSQPVESGCLIWPGPKNTRGYGITRRDGKDYRVTRIIWEGANGRTLQAGECVLHRCDNPPCVNPEHLFVGTRGDNARDMFSKGRECRKLTRREVEAIRKDTRPQQVIAREHGVSQALISMTKRGLTNK